MYPRVLPMSTVNLVYLCTLEGRVGVIWELKVSSLEIFKPSSVTFALLQGDSFHHQHQTSIIAPIVACNKRNKPTPSSSFLSSSSLQSFTSICSVKMAGKDENSTPPSTPKGAGGGYTSLTARENEILSKAMNCLKAPPEVCLFLKPFSLLPQTRITTDYMFHLHRSTTRSWLARWVCPTLAPLPMPGKKTIILCHKLHQKSFSGR